VQAMTQPEFTPEQLDRTPGVLNIATWDDEKFARYVAARKQLQDDLYSVLFKPFDGLFPSEPSDGETVYRAGLASLRSAIEKNCPSLGQQATIAGATLEIAMGLLIGAKISSDKIKASGMIARAAAARATKAGTDRAIDDIIANHAQQRQANSKKPLTCNYIANEIAMAVNNEVCPKEGLRLRAKPLGISAISKRIKVLLGSISKPSGELSNGAKSEG
jgi:hypothetical protein